MKKVLRNVVLSIFGLVSVITLSNCQIGLGEAVDVQPPTISLTSPQADALVRDVFIIEGNYEDDLSVSGISLSLKEVYTEVEYKQITAVVKPTSETELTKGTWSCSINPKELGIKDGTYVATVTAMDTYLHTGIATQTFSIDNTAPLIVLTSPSSTTLDNPTSYGQVFSVEGKAADDSDVDSIDAIIYDENGTEIARKTITNVSTQIQIDVATWGAEDEFYKSIYGSNQDAGTKKYKLGFIAYDGARKVPAVEGDRGNSTSVFYMNNDFAEIDGFKTNIAYNILNGTRAATDPYATWKKALDDKKVSLATFSLNPINNPYFDVQSYEPISSQDVDLESDTYAFMNKNKLTVNIYVGRDKKAIKTETIGIYLLPCDRKGNLLKDLPKVTLLSPYKDKDGNVIGTDNTKQITTVGSTSYKWSSEALDAKNIEGFNIGKYYLFDVVAYDYNGVGIRNDNKFAIKLVSTSAAPIITITEPGATKSVANSESFLVKGTIKTGAEIVSVKVCKNVDTEIVSGPFVPGKNNEVVLNKEESTDEIKVYNFSFAVPEIKEDAYSILVYATDSNEQFSSKEIVVTNDKNAPEFDKNPSITPYVDVVEKDASGNDVKVLKVNGNINIKQLITDDTQVSKVEYSLDEGKTWIENTQAPITTLNISVNTEDYDNEEGKGEKYIYVKAIDKAGNIAESKTNIKLNIDQATDAPRINFSNVTIADEVKLKKDECGNFVPFTEEELIIAKLKASVFGTKSNRSILGTIEDDDGIETVTVLCCKDSIWDNTKEKEILSASVEGKTTYNLKADLPSEEGTYLIKIVVTDKANETEYSTTTIQPFLVAVDDGAPVLEITTPTGVFRNGNFVVEGKINDATATIVRIDYDEENEIWKEDNPKPVEIKDDLSWQEQINTTEVFTFKYIATDEYNQKSEREFNFKYDPIAPRFSITEIQGVKVEDLNYGDSPNYSIKQEYGNTEAYFAVKGSVTDSWDKNELDKNRSGLPSYFYYYVSETELSAEKSYTINEDWETTTIRKEVSTDGSINGTWEALINFGDEKLYKDKNTSGKTIKEFAEGKTLYVYFAAKDNAENVSTIANNPSKVLSVKIDGTAPIVQTPESTITDSNTTISVTTGDGENGSGIESVKITCNGKNVEEVKNPVLENGQFVWTISNAVLKDKDYFKVGENNFVITATDKAKNQSAAETTIQNNTPNLEITDTGINLDAKKLTLGGKQYSYIKEGFVVKGKISKASESESLSNVTVTCSDSNGKTVDVNFDPATGEFTIPAITDFADYHTPVTRTITATNVYGNSTSQIINFVYDGFAPRFSITKIQENVTGFDINDKDTDYADKGDINKYGTSSKTFEIAGTVKDDWCSVQTNKSCCSGAKFYYYLGNSEPTKTSDNSRYEINDNWTQISVSSNGSWKETLSFEDSKYSDASEWKLYFAAVDNVGNVSEISKNPNGAITIKIDNTAPIVEEPTKSIDNENTTISVKASDSVSRIASVRVTCNGRAAGTATLQDEKYIWTMSNENLKDQTYFKKGDNTFEIIVEDIVGNETSKEITIKHNAPTIEIASTGIPENAPTTVQNKKQYSYIKEGFEVTGTVTIDGTLGTVSYSDSNGKTGDITLGSNGAFSISPITDFTGYNYNQPVTRTITATSVYGLSTTYEINFIYDNVAPRFGITNVQGEVVDWSINTSDSSNFVEDTIQKYGTKSKTFEIAGTVSDGWKTSQAQSCQSGAELYYYLGTAEPSQTDDKYTIAEKWTQISVSTDGSWELSLKFDESKYPNGTDLKLYFATKDKVGNVSEINKNPSALIKIKIDNYKPTISSFEKDGSTQLSVSATDQESGVASYVLYRNNVIVEGAQLSDGKYAIKDYVQEGKNTFKVVVIDNAGNENASEEITINNTKPKVTVTSNIDTKYKNAEGYLYSNADITVTLTVKDENELSSLVCDKDNTLPSVNENNSEQTVIDTITKPNSDSDGISRTYTATNVYGLETTYEFKYIFDVTAPVLNTQKDGDKPYSTIGGKDLGSCSEVWFNATDLQVAGRFTESGSGISEIKYKLNEGNEETILSTKQQGYETFRATISGFVEKPTEEVNVLRIWAEDNAGNKSEERLFSIKVDTTAPTVSNVEFALGEETTKKDASNVILSNTKNDITITGSWSDDSSTGNGFSGIDSIKIKVGNEEISATITEGTWTLAIGKDILRNLSGSHTLPITVKDKAGNTNSGKSLSLKIDTAKPTTEVNSPKTETELNGLVSFNGTVKEENVPESIQLYYYFTTTEESPSGLQSLQNWTTIDNWLISKSQNADDTDIKNWKFEDFSVNNLLQNNAERGTLFILPVAYDQAGNCSVDTTSIQETDYKKYTVDLNSDRPIIKFQNLPSSTGAILKYTTQLTGTITDDDGVGILKIANQTERPTDWTAISTVSNPTSFNFNLGNDGTKKLWFYIKDTAGKEFITSEKTVNQPYVSYKTAEGYSDNTNNNEVISFVTDSTAPVINSVMFGYGDSENVAAPSVAMENTNLVGGTKRKYVRFGVNTTDTNGIESVKVTGLSSTIELSKDSETDNYYSGVIDVSKFTEGTKDIVFEVEDTAGITATPVQKRITVDNSAPSIEIISPLSTDEVTGTVTITGTTSDEYSNISDVKYLVLDNTHVTVIANQRPEVTADKFIEFTNAGSSLRSWKFNLTNLPASEDAIVNYSNITHTEQDIYTLPIYFYMEDDLGNSTISKEYTLKYNPFGDRPKTEVTYPTGTIDDKANVNGAIRVTGSASDNVSVKEVYIQLDVNKDRNFDNEDITILDACLDAGTTGNKVYTIVKSATDYKTGDAANADMSAIEDVFWGIKVNGKNSWNYTINKFAELLQEGNKVAEGKYAVNIRSIAVDNNYKFGKWSETQYVEFDTNIPSIGRHNKNVKEYSEDGTSVKASKAYITDMYLKGKASLELSVEDKEGIKQVMYYIATSEEGLASAKGEILEESELGEAKTWTDSQGKETKGYIVTIPLAIDSNASGTKYVKVVATKDSDTETTAYEKFSVNFDNSVPTLNALNGISLNGVNHDDSSKKVVNSNGTYFTLGATVQDDGGSGFDKLVYYYYRQKADGTNGRIYNPMIDSISSKDAGRADISSLKTRTIDDKSIYGTEQTVSIAEDKKTITLTSASSHIRAGGLVNIEGSWITIESVSGTKVTLKSDSSVTGSGKTAFFAYAQVIDNTGSEKTNASGDLTSGDDGDGMAESIIKSLNTWTCDATFHSNYIPDGPGKLVVFAFDKAGNVASAEYEASVQNNAPRLTRVMLATDLNGDGSYQYYSDTKNGPINDMSDDASANGTEFGEFAFYSTLNNEGQASNEIEVKLPAGRDAFIVKNNLLVVPEFVGGNGTITYTYKIADSIGEATITTGTTTGFATTSKVTKQTGSVGSLSDSKTTVKDVSGNALTTTSYEFEIGNTVLKGKESWDKDAKGTKYLAATFWDSTEETTPGVDSCYALLKMPLIINVVDDNAPTANIIPFYWNSKDDSSFVYDTDGNPLGHIDIPSDNSNPGVSGEVYIEGYAWDDTKLGGILITAPDGTEKKVASYSGGVWSEVKTDWPTNWNSFEILEDSGIKQSGHTVKWRFHINMTSYGLDEDKSVIVKAIDAQNNEMSGTGTYTISNVTRASTYTMDFVPYIKSIYSEGVGFANRSRLGKFPVRAGENMVIEGMNFASGATYTVKFYKSNKLVNGKIPENTAADSTENATFVSDGKISVTAPQYSRWVEVVVTPKGGTAVSTKNNSNTNGGYNIEAGYVAKANDKGLSQANTAGTNFWTDDRYISVWNVGTTFADSTNPIMGTIESITSTSTTFSVNKQIKSGFAQNTLYSLWGGEDNMMWTEVMGDNNNNGANTKSSSLVRQADAAFYSPPAETDTCVVNNTIFHTYLDDGWKDQGTFGNGLMLCRDGLTFADTESVELTKTDKYRHQFQNIKISGAYIGTQYHIYVTYFDAYTKCLKYGKFVYKENDISKDNADKNTSSNVLERYVTGTTTDSKYVVDGLDSTSSTQNRGQYSDIKIDTSDSSAIPVIAYYYKYSGDNGRLRIARGKSTTPQGANDTNWDYTDITSPSGAVDFGRFVAMEMDNSGNLHITAQDETNGILYYGFFNKTDSGYSLSTEGWQKVDSTCSGKWNDIKLENPDGTTIASCKPVITYMNKAKTDTTSAVKIAYYTANGFEAMTSPSSYAASDEKLSLVVNALDKTKETNKYAIGFNSSMLAVDFLRGEE